MNTICMKNVNWPSNIFFESYLFTPKLFSKVMSQYIKSNNTFKSFNGTLRWAILGIGM